MDNKKPTYEELEQRVTLLEKDLKVNVEGSELNSYTLFDKLTHFLPISIGVANNKGEIIYVNKKFIETFGYDHSEIRELEKWFAKAYPDPDYRNYVITTWTKDIEDYVTGKVNEPVIREYLITTKDGNIKNIEISFDSHDGFLFVGFTDITNRKKVENELIISDERWQFALEGAGDGVWDWNIITGEIFFSKQWNNMLGLYETGQIKSFSEWEKRIHPDDREDCIRSMSNHLQNKIPMYLHEHRIKTFDDTYKWVIDRGKVISRNNDQTPLRFVGIQTDITYRKGIEKALRDSKNMLDTFFKTSQDGFAFMVLDQPIEWKHIRKKDKILEWVFNHESVTKVNETLLKIYGYASENDYIGLKPFEIFNASFEYIQNLWYQLLENGKIHYELKTTKIDGTPIWVEGDYVCIYNEENLITGHFGIQRDITEYKQNEDRINESNLQLSEAQLIGQIGSWQSNMQQQKMIWTDQTYRLFGYEPDESLPNNILDNHIHPNDKEAYLKNISELFSSDTQLIPESEFRIFRKDHELRYMAIRGVFEFDNSGKKVQAKGTLQDITSRKLIENEIRRLHAAVVQSPTSIVITNLQGAIEYVNPAFTDITGYKLDEIIGKNPNILSSGLGSSEDYRNLWETITSGGVWEGEFINRKKNGDFYYEFATISPIKDEYGQITSFIAIKEDITQRKKTEIDLKESEAQYRTLFDSSGEAIVIIDGKTLRFNNCNRAALNLFGVSISQDFRKMGLIDFSPLLQPNGENSSELNYWYSSKALEIGHINYDWLFMRHGTMEVPALITLSTIKIKGKQYILAVIRDIIDRKQYEEKLKREKANLSSLIENTTDSIWSIDSALRIVTVNSIFKNSFLLAYGVELTPGTPILQKIDEAAREIWKERYNRVLAGEQLSVVDSYDYNNQTHFLNISINPILIDGKVVGGSCFAHDITEIKNYEMELKKSMERLELTASNANIGIWNRTYSNISEIFINPVLSSLFGFSNSKTMITEQEFMSKVHPNDYNDLLKIYNKHETGELDEILIELRLFPTTHNQKWILWRGRIINRSKDQTKMQVIGIALDITENKQHVEELNNAKEIAESANKTKSLFLANMSHELRTPMNAIIGFSELLSKMIIDDRQLQYLDSILASSKTLLHLINDILDLSKIEAGKMVLQPSSVNIQSILEELKFVFSLRVQEQQIGFRMEIAPTLPEYLILDELRIKQILLNLIGNAVKFTDNGWVKIIVYPSPAKQSNEINLTLIVEDTGIGINKNNQQKIFEPFQQQDKQDIGKYGGTGLGLSIVKKITELMNGQITVQSEVNKGSTFQVFLPNIQISNIQSNKLDNANIKTDYNFNTSNIILFDDNITSRLLLKGYLAGKVNIIFEVGTEKEIDETLQSNSIDLLIIGIRIKMENLEPLIKKWKKNSNNNLQVLLISSSLKKNGQSADNRVDSYLQKPFRENELLESINTLLSNNKNSNLTTSLEYLGKLNKYPLSPNMLVELNAEIENCNLLIARQDLSKLQDFAGKVESIGKKYSAQFLVQYANQLKFSIDTFDIPKMRELLALFPKLINKIINQINGEHE